MADKGTDVIDRAAVRALDAAASRELRAGEAIRDWAIESKLADGGFGTVYVARHRRSGDRAALKLLHRHLVAAMDVVARFDREVEVIRRLAHPNIVRLVDAGVADDGRPYLCTELLDGDDLHRMLARRGKLSPTDLLAVLDPICEAVAYANDAGVIHRDIKASNAIACRTADGELGRVVLVDFGIAKLLDSFATELTLTAMPVGTPTCMAPEQIHGTRVDARTDVYALGVLMFHLLTGERAFYDPSPTMTQYLHLHAKRPRASELVPMPSRLDDIIIRAMAIDPASRYATARELLADARAAVRASAFYPTFQDTEAAAIMATVTARGGAAVNGSFDAALLADLEAAMPELERVLGASGFQLTVDLGSTALFAARVSGDAAVSAAVAAWHQLRLTPRHPRLQIGLCVHAGDLIYAGGELQPSPLLRPATWGVAEAAEGVWITHAIDAAARGGKRVA
jgi:serine/threonine-protein kinase